MPSKPFQPGHEAIVVSKLTFSGVQYAVGDRFPYQELGIIVFDLRGLWMAELIEFTHELYRSDADLERLTAPAPRAQPAKTSNARR